MKAENRIAGFLADAEKSFEPAESREHIPPEVLCWGRGGQAESVAIDSSFAWIVDLRKISSGQGILVHTHVAGESPEDITSLRQECDALRRDYGELREAIDGLKGTLDRLRESLEGIAEKRFAELSDRWKRETQFVSNITKKAIHPAYQQIIAMGFAAVPLMLRDLAENGPGDWFWALTTITGENPITEDIAGKMEAMTEAWLKWGVTKGFLSDSIPTKKRRSPDSPASAIE